MVNGGNVTETLGRGRVQLSLQRGAAHTPVRAEARELRPRTRGLVLFRYRGQLRGWVTARARIASQPGGPVVSRTFRVRL